MPTEHVVRRVLTKLGQRLGAGGDDTMLQQERLERASLKAADEVSQPAQGLLREALDDGLREWLENDAPQGWLTLLVLPPCQPEGLVEAWARAAGHQVATPPQRHELTADHAAAVPETDGAGLLVIPQLERWFIRQRNGLRTVRDLLARLAVLDRHCLVACNSWAWRFLVKSVGADVLLPQPRTLAAADASRLREWFAEHAADDAGRRITFRMASTGLDVLATDASGRLASGYLKQLAARSLGIPWVAGHMWRASLNVRADSDTLPERALRATAGDARTVWVAGVEDCRLPQGHEDRSMLALQALLIHDVLTAQELEAVLPATGEPDVVPALVASGFVQRKARLLRVRVSAYPAVRRALQSAGVPLGRM